MSHQSGREGLRMPDVLLGHVGVELFDGLERAVVLQAVAGHADPAGVAAVDLVRGLPGDRGVLLAQPGEAEGVMCGSSSHGRERTPRVVVRTTRACRAVPGA